MVALTSLVQSLGLTQDEARVYLAALELGEATMQDLARKAKVKRTTMYNFIDELLTRQFLVEMRRGKRKIYSAVAPEHLVEIAKTRMWELERALPLLHAIHNRSAHKPRVTFHEGIEGIKEVYNDMLTTKAPIIGCSDYKHMWATLGKECCEYFPPERAKRGISYTAIANDTPENRKHGATDKAVFRETKFIPARSDLRTEINIYGNKVLLASFRSHPAFAVLIEDADSAETLRLLFKELWQKL